MLARVLVALSLMYTTGCELYFGTDDVCGFTEDQLDALASARADVETSAVASQDQASVFGGTDAPTAVPLTPGQILAIGSFRVCSGTLIAPRWVLTAKHCPLAAGDEFCMGTDPTNADRCLRADRVISHECADVTLVELSGDARDVMPGVEPMPFVREPMGCDWLGETAEAAGYGKTETGALGIRYFIAEPIVELSPEMLTVHGLGVTGLCRGDSGGPVMVAMPDGVTRVAGALSSGAVSCRGVDHFTRTDSIAPWILERTGL